MKRFRISLRIDSELSVDELWPDGNAPEDPTTDDVRALVEEDGGIRRVLRDWNLIDGDCDDYSVTQVVTGAEMLERLRMAQVKP